MCVAFKRLVNISNNNNIRKVSDSGVLLATLAPAVKPGSLFSIVCVKKKKKKRKENSKSRAAALVGKKGGASIFRLTACIGKWMALM